jgi:hypothetical protein
MQNTSVRKREKKGVERILEEIMSPNFPTLMKNMNLHN